MATGPLPPNHWAYEGNVSQYACDPARAEKLLDSAGFPRQQNGIRFHLTLKASTEERARLIGAVLQEQWRRVGVDLEIRPLELATLFSDISRGNFQLNYLRWIGANSDVDFFEFAFSSKRFPPDGANRGHYRNPRIDALTDQISYRNGSRKKKSPLRRRPENPCGRSSLPAPIASRMSSPSTGLPRAVTPTDAPEVLGSPATWPSPPPATSTSSPL